jgi:hypothetical protein
MSDYYYPESFDIVLVNTEPQFGEWQEAVVIGQVQAVVVRLLHGADNSEKIALMKDFDAEDELFVPVSAVVRHPRDPKEKK